MYEPTEFRIVCHGAGQPGHQDHVFTYPKREVAEKMLPKRTEEWRRDPKTAMCTPFHLESRVRTPWVSEGVDGDAG